MPRPHRRLVAITALLALAALALTAGPLAAKTAHKRAKVHPDLTIMSRNLYLGADIIKLASATSLDDERKKATALFETAQKTNFPLRAKAIAREIARHKPDVIALQEVARYYTGGDAGGGGNGANDAKQLRQDWLALLQKQLRARHLAYKNVAEEIELDVQTPILGGTNVRIKLSNVVLARSDAKRRIRIIRGLRDAFPAQDQLLVVLKDQDVRLSRGFAGIVGSVRGKRFTFLAPHAEAYGADIARRQFLDLLRGAAKSRATPTIIAGDFNSDPKEPGGGYREVIKAGFRDTGKRHGTCCQDELLDNATSKLSQWIDHIVTRPKARGKRPLVLSTAITGNRTADRIGGLWPSDHAGVVAKIRLR